MEEGACQKQKSEHISLKHIRSQKAPEFLRKRENIATKAVQKWRSTCFCGFFVDMGN